MPNPSSTSSPWRTTTASGFMLIAASLLEILAMAHHPSVDTPDVARAVAQIAGEAGRSAVVHGVIVALMLCIVYGITDFVADRGISRPLVRAGAIAYAAGVVTMMGAALVSGFVITNLARLIPHTTAIDLQIDLQQLLLCRALNQSCAHVATIAMSAAILCWSLDLLTSARTSKAVGCLGLSVALVPAVALVTGHLRLDVHGMTTVVVAQTCWYVAVGALMIRQYPLK